MSNEPQDKLIVRDMTGEIRPYSIAQVMDKLVPQGVPQVDAVAFVLYCNVTGANPFAGEAFLVPFWTGGQQRGASVLGFQYFNRMAREDPQFDGMTSWLHDAAGNKLPKTADPAKIAGAVAQVWVKDRRFPVEAAVTLDECRKKNRKGEYQGFWKDDVNVAHMLQLRAEYRALKKAFPPKVGLRPPDDAEYDSEAMLAGGHKHEPRVVEAHLSEEQIEEAAIGQSVQTDVPKEETLTLAQFGRWCAAEQIPQDQADRAKAACGLGEYSWQDLKQQKGALQLVRARLVMWMEEGEPAEAVLEEPEGEHPTEAEILEELKDEARGLGQQLLMSEAAIESALNGGSVDSITDTIAKWQDAVNARQPAQKTLGEA